MQLRIRFLTPLLALSHSHVFRTHGHTHRRPFKHTKCCHVRTFIHDGRAAATDCYALQIVKEKKTLQNVATARYQHQFTVLVIGVVKTCLECDDDVMIGSKPQQNSLFQRNEAKVLIPVWETEGEGGFFFIGYVASCHPNSGLEANVKRALPNKQDSGSVKE